MMQASYKCMEDMQIECEYVWVWVYYANVCEYANVDMHIGICAQETNKGEFLQLLPIVPSTGNGDKI